MHDGKTFANLAMATNIRITPEEFADVISIGSRSIFDVIWHENAFPRADLNCSSLCTLYGESCVCDVVRCSPLSFLNSSPAFLVDSSFGEPPGGGSLCCVHGRFPDPVKGRGLAAAAYWCCQPRTTRPMPLQQVHISTLQFVCTRCAGLDHEPRTSGGWHRFGCMRPLAN